MPPKTATRTTPARALPTMLAVLIAAIIAIGAYGHVRCQGKFRDPLSAKLHVWDLDGWSLTHLALFTLTGYFFPGQKLGLVAFGCGVAWELVEHWLGKARPSWLGGWGGCDAAEFEKENANWWFGRSSDIAVNGAGLLLGNWLARCTNPS